MNEYVERPWGTYETLLDSDKCKVKKISVKPKQRPSYQYHHKRSEVWVVVEGAGLVTLDEKETTVSVGDVVEVPAGAKHRIQNTDDTENLVFIEVQHGTYFGEDDIVRISDDYNR
jgi:mannose-6-phosphate isomerase